MLAPRVVCYDRLMVESKRTAYCVIHEKILGGALCIDIVTISIAADLSTLSTSHVIYLWHAELPTERPVRFQCGVNADATGLETTNNLPAEPSGPRPMDYYSASAEGSDGSCAARRGGGGRGGGRAPQDRVAPNAIESNRISALEVEKS